MIWRRSRGRTNPEQVFERVREVEKQLRIALQIFRNHLEELETEIDHSRVPQDREEA